MLDLRVPTDPIFQAFGVSATVTRPAPDETPITTTVAWMTPQTVDGLIGGSITRREARRIAALRLDEVPTVPRGTLIDAPEELGGEVKRWFVESVDRIEPDLGRYVVVHRPDPYAVEPDL